MCQKFTRFKIVIKNLVGGTLAWVYARGEEGRESSLPEGKLYCSWTSGRVFFSPGWSTNSIAIAILLLNSIVCRDVYQDQRYKIT